MTTLKQLGEREVIRRLAAMLPSRPDVRVHIGDDVAVVSGGAGFDFLLTSDAVIEGTHFLADAAPEQIGHKAIGRALSDLGATGGEPLWALIDVVAPANLEMERLEGVYRGLERLASRHGLAVVGGDLAQGPALELHVFAVGRVPAGQAVLRSGAQPGDLLYVTGALGGSLREKHLTFEPRVREGVWLREQRWATSLIDVSDGLATDLRHILDRSHAGAELETARIPISKDAATLDQALYDGEDFELLFTVAAEQAAAFEAAWAPAFSLPCTSIGRITAESGVRLRNPQGRVSLLAQDGFEHFVERDKT